MKDLPAEIKKHTQRPSRKELEEKYQTLTLFELANYYSVSSGTVKNWIQGLGIHKKTKNISHSDFSEYYYSHTIKDTANHFGISNSTAKSFAKKLGIYVKQPPFSASKDELEKLYKEMTANEIANIYGVPKEAVVYSLKKHGIRKEKH